SAMLAGALLAAHALRRGRTGRALAAMRDHEAGASAAGVRVPALKLTAFVAGAALAALGGGMLGMGLRAFDPAAYDPVRGLLWFAAIVVLGADSVLGALLAAALLVGLDAGTRGGVAAALIGLLAVFVGRFPGGPYEALRLAAERLRLRREVTLTPLGASVRRRLRATLTGPGTHPRPAAAAGATAPAGPSATTVTGMSVLGGRPLVERPVRRSAPAAGESAAPWTSGSPSTSDTPGRTGAPGTTDSGLPPVPGGIRGEGRGEDPLRASAAPDAEDTGPAAGTGPAEPHERPAPPPGAPEPGAADSGGTPGTPRAAVGPAERFGAAPPPDAGRAAAGGGRPVSSKPGSPHDPPSEDGEPGTAATPRAPESDARATAVPRAADPTARRPARPRLSPAPPVLPLLRARGLRVAYDGFTALDGVDLDLSPGRITAVVGPNGAGKSTLFHCLAGTVRPDAGRIGLGERDITRLPAHARTRLGIARTFQQLAVFPTLTVAENVRVGAEQGRVVDADAVERMLRLLGLDGAVRALPAAGLPTGTLRRVELARALAGSPRVLLLDEPAAGLDTGEVTALARVLGALAADGTALLVVEHDLDLVAELADTVHVMTAGRVVASGPADHVLEGLDRLEAHQGHQGGRGSQGLGTAVDG
ncbi:ATP-binding cassette domain-containing protein, partial [Streptomyces sp. NPDC020766]|uniref:ATP-binding cassette domain-containing protein n=1 Tax=Streptomyces sp. NPDC020766 TaxID=3155011 RepID=UPI0034007353